MYTGNERFYDVMHPELVLVTPRLVAISDPVGDSFALVDILMIQSIELLPKRSRRNGNGHRGTKG